MHTNLKLIEVAVFLIAGIEFYFNSNNRIMQFLGIGLFITSGSLILWIVIPWNKVTRLLGRIFKKQRISAIVLFTDIVGYQDIKSQDELNAQHLIEKNCHILKPIVEKHNGSWLKEALDCTISCFKNSVDAVNCALEIQRALSVDHDLQLRIGIHGGDVVFSGYDILGDGITEAAGIEVFAEPGGICMTERVYD